MSIIAEDEKTYYVLVVENVVTNTKSESRTVVELAMSQLPPDRQALAEVRPVAGDGKQLLHS